MQLQNYVQSRGEATCPSGTVMAAPVFLGFFFVAV